MKYELDDDLKLLELRRPSANIYIYPFLNIALSMAKCRSDDKVNVKEYGIAGYKGGKISVMLIEPVKSEGKLPCIVMFHGGGFLLKAASAHYRVAKWYAEEVGCKVLFVDYRLMPMYRFPYAIEDSYNAYEWALRNSDMIGIDEDKMMLVGDSAGGNIAAALNLMLSDRGGKRPLGTILIYPAVDRRMRTESMRIYTEMPVWDGRCNRAFWKAYLKGKDPEPIRYASIMEAESLKVFTPTYMEVAQFDCLHDEGVEFAERLKGEGVPVEFHETKGACHGYETALESHILKEAMAARIAWMNKLLKNE
ncbi:MAG: alpha/beta hydrolase [Lachnospiraceae bacterium]|nr:alpha/beta hydrolase [Lachnospiraceae bacterium]